MDDRDELRLMQAKACVDCAICEINKVMTLWGTRTFSEKASFESTFHSMSCEQNAGKVGVSDAIRSEQICGIGVLLCKADPLANMQVGRNGIRR